MGGTSSTETAPAAPVQFVRDLTRVPTQTLRRRSLWNLLRMGHCAPTVMQTLLDASDTEAEWLVKLTAGLPGGVGNTGAECGGVTAPLMLIGLRHARDATHDGLPPVIEKGHDLLQPFADCHGTTLCREIRGTDRADARGFRPSGGRSSAERRGLTVDSACSLAALACRAAVAASRSCRRRRSTAVDKCRAPLESFPFQ